MQDAGVDAPVRDVVVEPPARDATTEPPAIDAGPCSPGPPIDAPCAKAILGSAAGTPAWEARWDTGSSALLGPVAADASGATYFLAARSALYVDAVRSFDACGGTRWLQDVSDMFPGEAFVPHVIVSQNRLLLVTVRAIVALDLDTGQHVWTADVDQFAKDGGLGVPPGKVMPSGYAAAAADGTTYTVVNNDRDAWILAVDAQGGMRPVAQIPQYVSGMGYTLPAQQLVIDAAGRVVLAGGRGDGAGEFISCVSPDGELQYKTTLEWGNGTVLAAGPDYLTGNGMWILNADGSLRNERPSIGSTWVSWGGPTNIDADGNLVVAGGQKLTPGSSEVTYNLLGRFASDGAELWNITLPHPWVSGPVLGDDDQVFMLTSPEPDGVVQVSGFALADGRQLWQHDTSRSGEVPSYWMLLTEAGALVFKFDNTIYAVSSGGQRPPRCAWWPTGRGGPDQRATAFGQ